MITEFCCGAEAPKEVEEEKPHDFEEHTYKIITKCDFCRKVLKGMRKQVGLLMLMFFAFRYLESFTNWCLSKYQVIEFSGIKLKGSIFQQFRIFVAVFVLLSKI